LVKGKIARKPITWEMVGEPRTDILFEGGKRAKGIFDMLKVSKAQEKFADLLVAVVPKKVQAGMISRTVKAGGGRLTTKQAFNLLSKPVSKAQQYRVASFLLKNRRNLSSTVFSSGRTVSPSSKSMRKYYSSVFSTPSRSVRSSQSSVMSSLLSSMSGSSKSSKVSQSRSSMSSLSKLILPVIPVPKGPKKRKLPEDELLEENGFAKWMYPIIMPGAAELFGTKFAKKLPSLQLEWGQL